MTDKQLAKKDFIEQVKLDDRFKKCSIEDDDDTWFCINSTAKSGIFTLLIGADVISIHHEPHIWNEARRCLFATEGYNMRLVDIIDLTEKFDDFYCQGVHDGKETAKVNILKVLGFQ